MSQYNQQGSFPARKKNALDNYNFNIRVPVPNEKGKTSNLIWEITRNSLGIKIYTGFTNDQGNQGGMIRARLDGIAFYGFLEMLKEAYSATEPYKNKIEYHDFTFFNRKRSDTPVLQSTVYVGRDEDGIVWISIVDNMKQDRPRIKFPFGAGRNHRFKTAEGEDFSKAQVSQLFAKAYYNMLSSVGSTVMAREYVEPPKRDFGGNQGGNRSGGGEQSGAQSSSYSDDDIPFD